MATSVLLLAFVFGGAAVDPLQLVVQTPYGSVRGLSINGTRFWRGIPFAKAPVGDLRFRPPQPPGSWEGVLDTVNFKASCLQMGSAGVSSSLHKFKAWTSLNLTNSSEDCLYLNVYAPIDASLQLPVMVYLHAGEFQYGGANDEESNWPYFANHSIVLVTSNCRLGLFGYAALDALRGRDPLGSTGNYGMQDQRAVLKWVKQSIAAFGGNPSKVTIFGESSGGTSVGFHISSKASVDLFARAILQSPGLTQSKPWVAQETNTQFVLSGLTAANSSGCTWPTKSQWLSLPGLQAEGRPLAQAKSLAAAQQECEARSDCYVVSTGHSLFSKSWNLFGYQNTPFGGFGGGGVFLLNMTHREGKAANVETSVRMTAPASAVDCLVHASSADLINLNSFPPYGDTFDADSAGPTEDGVELLGPLATIVNKDLPSKVDLLGGSNMDEGTQFMSEACAIKCDASEADFEAWTVKQFGLELGPKVPPLYQTVEQPAPLCKQQYGPIPTPVGKTSQWWQAAMRAAGDNAITCRTRSLLQAAREKALGNTWWYYFVATPIYSLNTPQSEIRYQGAFHGAEVPFVFGDSFELSSDGERHLSQAMGCYWVNFAATGDPNEGPSGCVAALSLPKWPALGADGDAIEFSNSTIKKRAKHKKDECDLFSKYADGILEALVI